MKKLLAILLFTFTFSLLPVFCSAQFNTYHPFPDSNAVWSEDSLNCSCGMGCDDWGYAFVVKGDTIVNGHTYRKVYQNTGYWSSTCSVSFTVNFFTNSFFGAYREDSAKHVYACCTSYLGSHDSLLYDFNMKVGDTVKSYTVHNFMMPGTTIVQTIDSVLVGATYRKRFNFDTGSSFPQAPAIIEGVGSSQGLFDFLIPPFEIYATLDCFTQNNLNLFPMNFLRNCGVYAAIDQPKQSDAGISVYPNPGSGKFTLEAKNEELKASSIEVFNMLGEKIYAQFTSLNSLFTIDLSSQPNGIYLYRVVAQNRELIGEGKIVIQR